MLFNSLEFLLLFVPVCVMLFYAISKYSQKLAVLQLLLFSLLFYSIWNPYYVTLLIVSIVANFTMGRLLEKRRSKALLVVAVSLNLLSIAYFKYMDFFIDMSNHMFATAFPLQHIILPLGISFFTFQQISFVVECYRGNIKNKDFLSYALFVSFFPQLIAGPIVRFQEIVPQFLGKSFGQVDWSKILIGLIVFSIGLSQKVFFADHVASQATEMFHKADSQMTMSFVESWLGALSYSFQIYFDFSAYSNMAIGLGLMLGLKLPVNFLSPYKSKNIIEFWRTWHITLSRFLRDYLYYPLGGNRQGKARRYLNLMIVMLLGGLWHGASLNFIIWGGIHGMYLMINHGWQTITNKTGVCLIKCDVIKIVMTFICVTVAWVFFRAETLDGALHMIQSMFDLKYIIQEPVRVLAGFIGIVLFLFPYVIVVWFLPNAFTIKEKLEQYIENPDQYGRKAMMLPCVMAALSLSLCVYFIFAGVYSEFIYFQF